jgi:hypothetical protein
MTSAPNARADNREAANVERHTVEQVFGELADRDAECRVDPVSSFTSVSGTIETPFAVAWS